jgi:hypothetical protein
MPSQLFRRLSWRVCHPADAKQWLRDHGHVGAVAIVERVNGKISKSWPYEIDPPDDGASDDDLALIDVDDVDLDDSDLLNPALVRAKIENAKLRAQLDASRNGYSPVMDRLLEQVLAERLKQVDPVQEAVAKIRAVKEAEALFTRREPNPAPTPQPIDPEASVFQMLARDDGFVDKIAGGIIGKLMRDESSKDEPGWETVAMEAVKSGQAAAMVNSLMSGLQGIVAMILPQKAQQQTTPTHPDLRGQAAPAMQPAQTAPQAAPADVQQPSQTATSTAATGDPYTAMLTDVIMALMQNAPVDGAIKRVDGFLLLAPQYTEFINGRFGQEAGALLSAISTIPGCEQIAQLPHAKQWIEQFQAGFFEEEEEGEEASEDSPDLARAGA